MGRMGVNYSDISNKAHELLGLGITPTVDNIREALKTGSRTTIAKYLKEWKNSQNVQSFDENTIPTELLNLIKGLWQYIQDEATKKILEHEEEMSSHFQSINQQLQQAYHENDTYKSRIQTLEAEVQSLSQMNQNVQIKYHEIQHEHSKAEERLIHLRERIHQITAEKDKLHEHIKHMQKNLEHYQTTIEQIRHEQLLEAEKERARFDQRIQELNDQLARETIQKHETQVELEQHKTLLQQHVQLLEALQKEKEIFQQMQVEHHSLINTHETLVKEYQSIKEEIVSKSHLVYKYQAELASANTLIQKLEHSLNQTEYKMQVLRDEKTILTQEKANLIAQFKQLQLVSE